MRRKNITSLVLFVFGIFLIQFIGGLFTSDSVRDWYVTLQKPSWNPPPWLFGPVWTVLYLMIAVSGWLIYIKVKPSKAKRRAFFVYGLQLFFNFIWTFLFFFLKSPLLGLIDIVLLSLCILTNLVVFSKLYRPAAFLLLPYFIWTLFASALTLAIWNLNR